MGKKLNIKDVESDFKKNLVDLLLSSATRRNSELKSLERQEQEMIDLIDQNWEKFTEDIIKGINLFMERTDPRQQEQLIALWKKIASLGERNLQEEQAEIEENAIETEENAVIDMDNIITQADMEFLEKIAQGELAINHYVDASCMFRLMIQIVPFYGSAWVGWGICEQEQGNLDVVDQIYQMGTEMLPLDFFLHLYAAEFYIQIKQKEKARAILETDMAILTSDGEENSTTYKEMQKLMRNVA